VGLILVLRVNAFIALITAAVVVAVLSGGPTDASVRAAAGAFGKTAGNIGIVIALAAIIGKCLMDSGAADRIVRACMDVTGEKRAGFALLGSGFLLSIPVFFDTVFYLLVPLARSLHRQTHRGYLMYILAIGGGAAITHTLVPPTPGPLAVADNLGVELGMMIMMGVIIGFPTALVALVVAGLFDRWLQLPMRPYPGEEPDAAAERPSTLPPLLLALLPVVLPVVLISANTIVGVVQQRELQTLRMQGRVSRPEILAAKLAEALNAESKASPLVVALAESLPESVQERLLAFDAEPTAATEAVAASLDALAKQGVPETLPGVAELAFPRNVDRLMNLPLEDRSAADTQLVSWTIIDLAVPDARVETTWQRIASLTGFFGNANFALLLSAIVAMYTLVRYRKLTLQELGKTTETALMSGGVIILITAAGGAFGGVLQQSGLQDYVRQHVGTGSTIPPGILLLVAGFVLASLIKIAQGSSTVAMLTVSSIFAGMFPSAGQMAENLHCHPVYLALAIGAGSLVGCWMNDSGFWVVSRMSVFTESETLKAWTLPVAVLGTTAFLFTLVAAWCFPLV
ncbi:MAG: GntP family permease, partial [Planctomycetota bacterium]